MEDSKKIQEQLLISKIKIVADRNERFALIKNELSSLDIKIKLKISEFQKSIRNIND